MEDGARGKLCRSALGLRVSTSCKIRHKLEPRMILLRRGSHEWMQKPGKKVKASLNYVHRPGLGLATEISGSQRGRRQWGDSGVVSCQAAFILEDCPVPGIQRTLARASLNCVKACGLVIRLLRPASSNANTFTSSTALSYTAPAAFIRSRHRRYAVWISGIS